MNAVKWHLDRPTSIHFNDWLKEKAEAHERMKAASSKPRSEEVPASTVNKTKTGTKVFAVTTSNQGNDVTKNKSEKQCVACKDSHPLWRCRVFRQKTPTERTKLAAESKLCFSCLKEGYSFRECRKQKNAPETAVAALIILSSTGLTEFFYRKIPATRKIVKVVKQQRSVTDKQAAKAPACLP